MDSDGYELGAAARLAYAIAAHLEKLILEGAHREKRASERERENG